MPIKLHRAAACAALMLLGACSGEGIGINSAWNFGEASQRTFAAQVIDPTPVYEDAHAPVYGQQVANAIDRYRKGQVKRPIRQSTSDMKTSGGSGGPE